jgi:hypothetical protein
MSDESLRLLARQAIRNGRIPNRHPERMWGGQGGRGGNCAICDCEVGELGLDLEFNGADGAVEYPAHIDCFAAWKLECQRLGPLYR